jgi:chromosome segregation ATPase
MPMTEPDPPQIAPMPGPKTHSRNSGTGSGWLRGIIFAAMSAGFVALCVYGYIAYREWQSKSPAAKPPVVDDSNLQARKRAAAALWDEHEATQKKYDKLDAHLNSVRTDASKAQKKLKSALDFMDRAQATFDKMASIQQNCSSQVTACERALQQANATERRRDKYVITCENDLGKARNALDLAQRHADEAQSALTERVSTAQSSKKECDALEAEMKTSEASLSKLKAKLDQIEDRAQKAVDAMHEAEEKLKPADAPQTQAPAL